MRILLLLLYFILYKRAIFECDLGIAAAATVVRSADRPLVA